MLSAPLPSSPHSRHTSTCWGYTTQLCVLLCLIAVVLCRADSSSVESQDIFCRIRVKNPDELDRILPGVSVTPMEYKPGWYKFLCSDYLNSSASDNSDGPYYGLRSENSDEEKLEKIKNDSRVMEMKQDKVWALESRYNPTDPSFAEQWYLSVEGSNQYKNKKADLGVDINVKGAWDQSYFGQNTTTVIIDTGIETDNTDLKKNFDLELSYNYNKNSNYEQNANPYPINSKMQHGTATTSLIVASHDNGYCMSGVAPQTRWGGRFLIDASLTNSVGCINHALTANMTSVHIMSNSWGISCCDLNGICQFISNVDYLYDAITEGAINGNDDKGTTYVFASGNDGDLNINTSYGAECRHPHVICVGAITSDGIVANYTTHGSALFLTAPSGGRGSYGQVSIKTIKYKSQCTEYSAGTSFSAPLVSGVISLMLSANLDLNSIDIMHILARTSKVIDECSDGGVTDDCAKGSWVQNYTRKKHSIYYGFGLVDATAAVNLAKVWNRNMDKLAMWETIALELDQPPVKPTVTDMVGVWHFDVFADAFMEIDSVILAIQWHGFTSATGVPKRCYLELYVTSPAKTTSCYTTKIPASNDNGDPRGPNLEAFFPSENLRSLQMWGEPSYGWWSIDIKYPKYVGDQTVTYVKLGFTGREVPFRVEYDGCSVEERSCSPITLFRSGGNTIRWLYNPGNQYINATTQVGVVINGLVLGRTTLGAGILEFGLDGVEGDVSEVCVYYLDEKECSEIVSKGRTVIIPVLSVESGKAEEEEEGKMEEETEVETEEEEGPSTPIIINTPLEGETILCGEPIKVSWTIVSQDIGERKLEVVVDDNDNIAMTKTTVAASSLGTNLDTTCYSEDKNMNVSVYDKTSAVLLGRVGVKLLARYSVLSMVVANNIVQYGKATVLFAVGGQYDGLVSIWSSCSDLDDLGSYFVVTSSLANSGSYGYIPGHSTQGTCKLMLKLESFPLVFGFSNAFEVTPGEIAVVDVAEEPVVVKSTSTFRIDFIRSDMLVGVLIKVYAVPVDFATLFSLEDEPPKQIGQLEDYYITETYESYCDINVESISITSFDVFMVPQTDDAVPFVAGHYTVSSSDKTKILIGVVVGVVVIVVVIIVVIVVVVVLKRRRGRVVLIREKAEMETDETFNSRDPSSHNAVNVCAEIQANNVLNGDMFLKQESAQDTEHSTDSSGGKATNAHWTKRKQGTRGLVDSP